MNPLMSGDSPKRFKEEEENNLKTEEKQKNLKDNRELKKDDVQESEKVENDKQKAECLKDDKNDADDKQEGECFNDKNDIDSNLKTATTETLNQQSISTQTLKDDSNQTEHDPNKTTSNKKPTVNIFQFDKPKTDQVKPSPFLFEKNEVKEEEKKEPFVVSKEEEEIDHIFKEKCCFYKFFKKWEKIGYGTIYITREKENKRLIFFREGTMSKLIDLLLNFDCKPYKKEKGVGFINFKEVDGKIIRENVLLSFDSQLLIDKFYDIIRN